MVWVLLRESYNEEVVSMFRSLLVFEWQERKIWFSFILNNCKEIFDTYIIMLKMTTQECDESMR